MSREIKALSPEQQAATDAALLAANSAEARAKLAEAELARQPYSTELQTSVAGNSADRPSAVMEPVTGVPEHTGVVAR
jgi:hypothetical protein